jgi:FkbM family methyltransferase
MLLKKLVWQALNSAGYELRRKPQGHKNIAELRGIDFDHFLHYYLRSHDLSRFRFVQVGAHNGVSNDWLYNPVRKFGLKGILIEPQPSIFRDLQSNYSDCNTVILENVAISSRNGIQPLYTIKESLEFLQYANQVASFSYDHIRRELAKHLTKGARPEVRKALRTLGLQVADCIEAQTVKTCTFETVLDKYAIENYNLLQIDTEGYDYEIIKMAGIDKVRPSLINYEHEHLSARDRDDCWEYLQRKGYSLFTHGGDSTAYLIDESPPAPDLEASLASSALGQPEVR